MGIIWEYGWFLYRVIFSLWSSDFLYGVIGSFLGYYLLSVVLISFTECLFPLRSNMFLFGVYIILSTDEIQYIFCNRIIGISEV